MKRDRPVAQSRRDEVVEDSVLEIIGTHALGVTFGAIIGAVVGAICGIVAGPIGSLGGAVGGGILGAALGASTGVPRRIDNSAHDAYWRENYATRPYVPSGAQYKDYEPAYRYGIQSYLSSELPREWDEVEAELSVGWPAAQGISRLKWDEAKHAVRDAWDRMRGVA